MVYYIAEMPGGFLLYENNKMYMIRHYASAQNAYKREPVFQCRDICCYNLTCRGKVGVWFIDIITWNSFNG